MLNKRASAGQGSNDDFKHLIQVNARNFNLFESRLCMKCFPSKQAETLFWQSFCYLFSSGSVGVRQGRPLTHLTWLHGMAFFASLDMISSKLTLNSLLCFRFLCRSTRNGRTIISNGTNRNAKSSTYRWMRVMDYCWPK